MLMLIIKLQYKRGVYSNFNTSHVNVNLAWIHATQSADTISIHLMLMLINKKLAEKYNKN